MSENRVERSRDPSGKRMPKATSPTRFSGETDHFYDPNFTVEISQRMRVPKRIKVDGMSSAISSDIEDEEPQPPSTNHAGDPWSATSGEKLSMQVPDRILVLGEERHFGTRAPPREILLEDTVMPPDPGHIRIQTPPHSIKLEDHYFPSADDVTPLLHPGSGRLQTMANGAVAPYKPASLFGIDRSMRESTPGHEGMSTGEEVVHLRTQLAKMNRRIMSIELENQRRRYQEKVVCYIGIAYFLVKALLYLQRTN